MSILRRIWASYNKVLHKHTQIVQSVQTSVLLGTGDAIAQKCFEPPSKPYDYIRTLRFGFIGLALGPGLMVWYKVLERVAGREQTLKVSLKKVALDQLVFSPVMIVVFMSTLNLLEGSSLDQLKNKINNSYTDILLNNWKVWPAVQILNFTILPIQFRVLFVQFVALGWNTYLAWKLHNVQDENKVSVK